VQAEAAQAEAARLEQAAANAEERVADAERTRGEAKLALEQARAVARPVLDTTARDGALAALERAR
jgi:chromosome segregation protein